ncbi:MAG: DUF1415 domain-containing protein [Sphingobacteriales bacterium]|nr:DUF1415 domain-containing protein [Sphingobacteriales bacterium]
MDKQEAQTQTLQWVEKVVIGCQFCPFAANPFKAKAIACEVSPAKALAEALASLALCFEQLNNHVEIATLLLVFDKGFIRFTDYLNLVDLAEQLLKQEGYEGVYQIASFHPDYLFAGSTADDPANYTNRSPYPMLHLLREDDVEQALDSHPNPEGIPERNILFAREKGVEYFKKMMSD